MIVQYIIDWEYIRKEVVNATSEGLVLINLRLREIKKAIETNGVLFLDANRLSIRELNEIIKDLRQDSVEDTISEWQNITDTLTSFQRLYDECRILLPETHNPLAELLLHRDRFLVVSHLAGYDLPFALITDVSYECGALRLNLEDYSDSEVERVREEWSNISFGAGDECAATKFWAGLSLGACANGTVTVYDPYCGNVLSGSESNLASFDAIMGVFVSNKHIDSIRMVFRKEIVAERWCFNDFEKNIRRLMGRRNFRRDTKLTIRFRAKPICQHRLFHDRWIDVGINKCGLSNSFFDVYECRGGNRRIRCSFSAEANADRTRQEIDEQSESCHTYYDLIRNAQITDEEKGLIRPPSASNDTAEIEIVPPIVIHV